MVFCLREADIYCMYQYILYIGHKQKSQILLTESLGIELCHSISFKINRWLEISVFKS